MRSRRLKNILAMVGLAVVLSNTGCGKNEDKGFVETLEENKYNTFLDEVIEYSKSDLLEKVTMLEEYIDLSNKLSKYDIPKVDITYDMLYKSELLDAYEIESLYNEYELDGGTENKDDLLLEVNIQQTLVNKFIRTEGYEISSNLALLVLRTKIAESYGLPTDELTLSLFNNIVFPTYNEYSNIINDSIDTLTIGERNIKMLRDYKIILRMINDLQVNDSKTTSKYYYKKDRNDEISTTINKLEKKLSKDYKLKFK